jgi:signal transduction histidine kinase/PAS domain-containing protein
VGRLGAQQVVGGVDLRHPPRGVLPAAAIGVPALGLGAVGGGQLALGRANTHAEDRIRIHAAILTRYNPSIATEEELAANALVEGLETGAPVGFALVEAGGDELLTSPSLAGVRGVRRLALDVLATGRAHDGAELDTAGGRRLVATCRPLEHEGRRMAAVVAVDVTEWASTEAALRASERELSAAQRMARMGWWVLWPQSGVAVQSRELLELTGMDRERERALSTALREAGRSAVASGGPVDFRHPVPLEDGSVRTLHVVGDVVTGRGGEGTVLEGFAQDVTELVRSIEQQRTVAELDRLALGDAPVQELIEQVAGAAAATLGVRRVAAMELEPAGRRLALRGLAPPTDAFPRSFPAGEGSFAGYTLRQRRPVVVGDWQAEQRFSPGIGLSLGLRSGACVVVGGAEAPFGVLMAVADEPGRFGEEDIGFLQSVANLLAEGIERRRAAADIAELAAARGRLVAQALDAEERARRSMSESLHDGALQDVLAAGHDLWALGDAPGADSAREMLRAVVARLRAVMVALHPTVLAYGGLDAALRAVAAQQAAVGGFELEVDVDPVAVGHRDELLLSVARELLTNAARHARARRVAVTLRHEDGAVVLEVADDGAGMAAGRGREALAEGHIGLATSVERVAAVGGRLTVAALPAGGTLARAVVPLARQSLF